MAVRLREALATMPGYVGGRTVPNAIKLASNESPYPALPHVVTRLTDTLRAANRYPDPASSKLTAALAERYDLPVTQVVVGCGSVSLCQQLVQISTQVGDEVVYGWRAFEAYPVVAAIAGAAHIRVPLRDEVHDLAAMADAVTDATRLVFVCNPNNPTSTAVRTADLTAFLGTVPDHVLVVLDEAYHEFVTEPDVPDGRTLLDDHPNLVVLRTFSKAYGLAGLRVGYALAGDQSVATGLRQVQVPFAVSQLAQDAALACLEPEAEKELFTRVETVLAERARVGDALREMGYAVPPTQANFVWLALGERTADWAAGCAEQRVIVRPFAGEGARVTIGTPDENDQFLDAARALAE